MELTLTDLSNGLTYIKAQAETANWEREEAEGVMDDIFESPPLVFPWQNKFTVLRPYILAKQGSVQRFFMAQNKVEYWVNKRSRAEQRIEYLINKI